MASRIPTYPRKNGAPRADPRRAASGASCVLAIPVSPTGRGAAAAAPCTEANMELLTQDQRERMRANGVANAHHIARDGNTEDFLPVVKLFCPWGEPIWLLTELDPEDPDMAFGLCDLGMGFPELGTVRVSENAAVRVPGPARHRLRGATASDLRALPTGSCGSGKAKSILRLLARILRNGMRHPRSLSDLQQEGTNIETNGISRGRAAHVLYVAGAIRIPLFR